MEMRANTQSDDISHFTIPRPQRLPEGREPKSHILANHVKHIHLAGYLVSSLRDCLGTECPTTKTSFAKAGLLLVQAVRPWDVC